MRALGLAAAVALPFTGPAPAGETPAGLMWNRTGLPATLPLQLMTPPGMGYYLRLTDAETGAPALAAFAEGGAFFRVLVPPGTYRLHIAWGRDWQDETALFGPDTRAFDLAEPLSFAVTGPGRKSGHIVDLRPGGPERPDLAEVRGKALCQTLRIDPDSLRQPWPLPDLPPPQDGAAPVPRFPYPEYDIVPWLCD